MNIAMFVANGILDDVRVMKEANELSSNNNIYIFGLGKEKCFGRTQNGINYIIAKEKGAPKRIIDILSNYSKRKDTKINSISSVKSKNKTIKSRLLDIIKGLLLFWRISKYQRLMIIELKKINVEFDVFHCHDLDTLGVGVKVNRKSKKKLIYDSHELWTEMSGINPYVRKHFIKKEKKWINSVNTIFTVSNSISDELVRRYNLKQKPLILRNIPQIEKTNIVELDKDNMIDIIYVGYYLPGRGIEKVIDSFNSITNSNVKLFLRIKGKEEEIEALQSIINNCNKKDCIVMLPFVSQNELINEIHRYDLGLLPYEPNSLNNKYCLPNKLFQYLNAGVGVISNNLPEVNNIIKKYNCGITYDSDFELDFASKINSLAKKDVNLFKQNANKAIIDEFNWEFEKEVLLKEYSNGNNIKNKE